MSINEKGSKLIKAILLDFDGVISPGRMFSEIYSEEFSIPKEKLIPIFREMSLGPTIGKGRLIEIIEKYIHNLSWEKSAAEFLNYWLASDAEIDTKFPVLTKEIKRLTPEVKIYLASDQEKNRLDYIWNDKGLKTWLDGRFASCELGVMKSNPLFFTEVLKKLEIKPAEVMYFDDTEEKVESAISAGLNNSYVYRDFAEMRKLVFDRIQTT